MKALLEKQQEKKLQMQLLREAQNGNCERSFTQNKYEPEREATIKISLRPDRPFNPEQIHFYITPPLSLQEQLLTKEKLTKSEQIILENLLLKKKKEIEIDLEDIDKYHLSAKPTTIEGRTKLLLEISSSSQKPNIITTSDIEFKNHLEKSIEYMEQNNINKLFEYYSIIYLISSIHLID
jgi:hypothetical protein